MIVRSDDSDINKMKNNQKAGLTILLLLGLTFMLVINASIRIKAENQELAKAVFKVA